MIIRTPSGRTFTIDKKTRRQKITAETFTSRYEVARLEEKLAGAVKELEAKPDHRTREKVKRIEGQLDKARLHAENS